MVRCFIATSREAVGSAAVATAGTIALLALAVAPALSQRPHVAEPVEFETSAPAPDAYAERAGGKMVRRARTAQLPVTGVVRQGKRFDLVGLRWRGGRVSALKLRVRRDGGRWSRWVDVPVDADHAPDPNRREYRLARRASDPVWAGQADEVQLSAWSGHDVRDLRLHFVNTTGTATSMDRLRKTVRGAVVGAAGAIRSLVGADAGAQTASPAIVSREDWGAAACPPRWSSSRG